MFAWLFGDSDWLVAFGADSDFRILAIIEVDSSRFLTVGADQSYGSHRKRSGESGDGAGLFTLLLDVLLVGVFAFDDDFVKFGIDLDDLAGLVFVFAGSDFDGVVGFEFKHFICIDSGSSPE
jgi:hypothetical protein